MFIFRACIKIQFIFSDIRTMWANMIIKNGFKNEIFFFILFSFDVIFQNLFKNREPIPFEDNKNKVYILSNYVLMIIFFSSKPSFTHSFKTTMFPVPTFFTMCHYSLLICFVQLNFELSGKKKNSLFRRNYYKHNCLNLLVLFFLYKVIF